MQETNSLASCSVPWVFWVFFPFPFSFDFIFPVRILSMAWMRGLSLFHCLKNLTTLRSVNRCKLEVIAVPPPLFLQESSHSSGSVYLFVMYLWWITNKCLFVASLLLTTTINTHNDWQRPHTQWITMTQWPQTTTIIKNNPALPHHCHCQQLPPLTTTTNHDDNDMACQWTCYVVWPEVLSLPHMFWSALISVSFHPSPAKLAGKRLSNGPLRSVQCWSECSALISVLSTESLKLMYSLSDTEWCWTELSFTSVEQRNGVFTIKKEITTTRIELWTTWKNLHDQKLAISTCTMSEISQAPDKARAL